MSNELVTKLETIANRHTWQITAEDRETVKQALELVRAEQYRVDHDAEKVKNLEGTREQAIAQMSSISQMVAALTCDYDRLEELREELESLKVDIVDEWENVGECKRHLAECISDNPHSAFVPEIQLDISNATMRAIKADKELVDWNAENGEELADLEAAAGDCESQDDASERIQEDPLDINIRSDWQTIGETLEPSEFTILLCTGGPACRIVGELDQYKQPCRAWIEYQDWFTPWTELVDGVSHDDILTYCQQFYFGE